MKKYIRWVLVVLLTPIALFLILSILLYCPPVQRWAVAKVVQVASEKTGLDISVESVKLVFPLHLGVENLKVLQQNDSISTRKDTVANVKNMLVDVELLPLLKENIEVERLKLEGVNFNTTTFVDEARVSGVVKNLLISSKGIDLRNKLALINTAVLEDANVKVHMNDSVPPDTSTTKNEWKIKLLNLKMKRTNVQLRMPHDSLFVKAQITDAEVIGGLFDLLRKSYSVRQLDWKEGAVKYDRPFETAKRGFDYNHLQLSQIAIGVDSFSYNPEKLNLKIIYCTLQDKSGLKIQRAGGSFAMDSMQMQLPNFFLETPYSKLKARMTMDLNAFDERNPGKLNLALNASIAKPDLIAYLGPANSAAIQRFPTHPLVITGDVRGNMKHVTIASLNAQMVSAFKLKASGFLANVNQPNNLVGDIVLSGNSYNLDFITSFLPSSVTNVVRMPQNMTLDSHVKINGSRYNTTFYVKEGVGQISGKAFVDTKSMTYDAQVKAHQLQLQRLMPSLGLQPFSGNLAFKGSGTDVFSPKTRLDLSAAIEQFAYNHYKLNNVKANATIKNGRAKVFVDSKNELLYGTIDADALMSKRLVDATAVCNLSKADLYKLRIVNEPLTVGFRGRVGLTTDLKDNYKAFGDVDNIIVRDSTKDYHPQHVVFNAVTRRDSTYANVSCGDFQLQLNAKGGYKYLLKQGNALSSIVQKQIRNKQFDYLQIQNKLPLAHINLTTGPNNMFMKILKRYGYKIGSANIDMQASPSMGLNGSAEIYDIYAQANQIDTVRFNMVSQDNQLKYTAQVRNAPGNPQYVFNALFDGSVLNKDLTLNTKLYDSKNKLALALGLQGEIEPKGVRASIKDKNIILGYKEFAVNDSNYVYISDTQSIYADVALLAKDKTGIHIYSNNESEDRMQDVTLSLQEFDVAQMLSIMPFMPKMQGMLNGDLHFMKKDKSISVSSSMKIDRMVYENSPLGNLSTELVYMPLSDGSHAVDGRLMRDNQEIAIVEGSYNPTKKDALDVNLSLQHTPLSIVNGFIPDQIVGLKGYADGTLAVKGTPDKPNVNGEVYLDSAYLVSVPYGIELKMDDDPVRIVGSNLLFENFNFYSHNEEPLLTSGYFDFSDLDNMKLNLKMKANNYLLIDAEDNGKSLAFGKAWVNFAGTVAGPLSQLKMRGTLDVLGSTSMTYILLDSPLNNDNRFEGLVTFVDFREKKGQVVKKPTVNGLEMDLRINVDNDAHVRCDLNTDHSNYVDLIGGGELRMRYSNANEIQLNGRYTIRSGEMKYSLPVIPLKTFIIDEGSYVEFKGEAMNPTIQITATEQNKATVTTQEGAKRTVLFNCGVKVTNTLKNMGLEFIVSCQEDTDIANQLQAMSKEERGKIAVTMLTTGQYLHGGSSNNFSMGSSLNSFLQSQINAITGSALKTIDMSFNMDNSSDASGSTRTNYSVKFAKRFLDNRLNVIVGGSFSSGGTNVEGTKDTFLDNITVEYRLNPNSNKYLKGYYKRDSYDWLDGYIGEYEVGFLWRRKLQHFQDIFRFKTKEKKSNVVENDSIPAVTQPTKEVK